MRRLFSISALVFFSIVYLLSSNDYLLKIIVPLRCEITSIFGSDRYRYGDLYGFSYLRDFKILYEKKPPVISNCTRPGNVNLYMLCDSYIAGFVATDSVFCNVNKYKFARWSFGDHLEENLDTAKKNILIIEAAERNIRKLFNDTNTMYYMMNVSKEGLNRQVYYESESYWQKVMRYLYNEKINQNIEFNLFEYRFLTSLRELKAELNYKVFNRTDKDVIVSADKKYLFYNETIDTSKKTSSFSSLNDTEVRDLVASLNNAYKHFKAWGFDEVYLSIVPNPVTIIEPGYGKHNDLINRIQNNQNLVIPVINILPLFKNSQKELYLRSDTHWNYDGFQIWVDETNKMLKKYGGK